MTRSLCLCSAMSHADHRYGRTLPALRLVQEVLSISPGSVLSLVGVELSEIHAPLVRGWTTLLKNIFFWKKTCSHVFTRCTRLFFWTKRRRTSWVSGHQLGHHPGRSVVQLRIGWTQRSVDLRSIFFSGDRVDIWISDNLITRWSCDLNKIQQVRRAQKTVIPFPIEKNCTNCNSLFMSGSWSLWRWPFVASPKGFSSNIRDISSPKFLTLTPNPWQTSASKSQNTGSRA